MGKNIEDQCLSPQIVERLLAGDRAAFEEVFFCYFEKVRHFIFLTVKSFEEAEKLAQHVFIELWNRRVEIDPALDIDTYVYTFTRSVLFDHLRSLKEEETLYGEWPAASR